MKRRVSIVGLGRMGTRLVEASEKAGLEVVAILDSAPEPWGLSQRSDLKDRLTATESDFWAVPSDILVAATTAPSHAGLLEAGLHHGFKRFVIEKPFATGVGEARRVLDLADKVGARVIVNHARRYCPNFQQLVTLNGSEALGQLKSIYVALGGGSMGCLGVHFFDLFNLMYGALPTKVAATTTEPVGPNVRGVDLYDPGGSVFLTYPDGGRAFLDIGDDIGIVGGIKMIFERGIVDIKNEFGPWLVVARSVEDRNKPNTQYGLPLFDAGELFPWTDFSMMERWSAMMKDAASDDTPLSNGELGAESLEVFVAARIAAEKKVWVSLPLSAEDSARTFPIP